MVEDAVQLGTTRYGNDGPRFIPRSRHSFLTLYHPPPL